MLTDKIVVISGGAGLIGKKFSLDIARQNAIVIIADINVKASQALSSEIRAAGGRSQAIYMDITKSETIDALIESVYKEFGPIDCYVNNAYPKSAGWGKKLDDVTYDDFCQNINMHLGGYFLTMKNFAKHMQLNSGGSIVNIASIYGVIAPRFEIYPNAGMTMPVEYAAIKSGVIHLTKYFAQFYKKYSVRVNAISPGGIFDQQQKEFTEKYSHYAGGKGMLDPGDISGALLFLLSDASKFITGQNLIVDDGFSL